MTSIVISTSSFDVGASPELQALGDDGIDLITNPYGRKLTEAEISDLLDRECIGLIAGVEPLTDRVFQRAGNLRVISRCGTGIDNVDLEAAKRRGIIVRRTPEAPAAAVAELTVALMLSALRRIPESDRRLRSGEWFRPAGRLLGSRLIGLIGLGNIGRRVAELCRAFGAGVIAHDPQPTRVPDGVELTSLHDLLQRADIVSLHVPHVADTDRLIDKSALTRMRSGAILINTSRAGVVDEQALEQALEASRLSAAALDVFDCEPYTGPLLRHDNVVLTPHIGSNTRETRQLMEMEAVRNLLTELTAGGYIAGRMAHV